MSEVCYRKKLMEALAVKHQWMGWYDMAVRNLTAQKGQTTLARNKVKRLEQQISLCPYCSKQKKTEEPCP